MANARRFVQSEVKHIARILLVHKHVVPVVHTERIENDPQLLETFRRVRLAGPGFEARVQRKVSLPDLATLERARLELERRLQIAGLLVLIQMEAIKRIVVDSAAAVTRRSRLRRVTPQVLVRLRLEQLIAQPRVVQVLRERSVIKLEKNHVNKERTLSNIC